MGGMHKCPSASCGNQLAFLLVLSRLFIPAVMMKIPGKNGRNLNVFVFMGIVFFFSTQNMINKELDPAVGIVFMIERFIHPRRLGSAKDNFIIGFKFILSNFFKVTQ